MSTHHPPSFAQRTPRVVGILLLYYQPYAVAAVRQMRAMLNAVHADNLLVVVNNNGLLVDEFASDRVRIVEGDNALREFSGWQAGLHFCAARQLLSDEGVVVFANDTFCHHNKFGPITRAAFARAFKQLLKTPGRLAMAGELQRSASGFSMVEQPFSAWISSYLFALSTPLLQRLEQIVPPLELDQFFTNRAKSDQFLTGPLNANLARHITAWLFDSTGAAKWYGAKPLSDENLQDFIGKAKSILCEMHLSARVTGLGGELLPVFGPRWLQQARRLERLLPRNRLPERAR